MSDKIRDKAYRLFEYISQVYSIDLPVLRDVTKYDAELWWQADIIQSTQCKIKEFSESSATPESETVGEPAWLEVTKRSYDDAPVLPAFLEEWIVLSANPTKLPATRSSILRAETFESDLRRVDAFKEYIALFTKWLEAKTGAKPTVPAILAGWVDETKADDRLPITIKSREIEEKFEDDRDRIVALKSYVEGPWKMWSTRVFPLYRANLLYDQLFSLHQRLSVEGDRIEMVWGHLLFSWNHSPGNAVYHPLIVTPMNLHFDPRRREMSLIPSQTIPTRMDLECILNLDYPFKDELTKYSRIVNNGENPPEAWNHNQMRGVAGTFTGYISKESSEQANLYSDNPTARPPLSLSPSIHNSPVIFVRERARRLWIEDAKKVAEAIYNGSEIPPFIRSLTADPTTNELPSPEDYWKKQPKIDHL